MENLHDAKFTLKIFKTIFANLYLSFYCPFGSVTMSQFYILKVILLIIKTFANIVMSDMQKTKIL